MRYRKMALLCALIGALLLGATACLGGGAASRAAEAAPESSAGTAAAQPELSERVLIEVADVGALEVELYPDAAPLTVRNFQDLVAEGFYDGLSFHRLIPGFVIQGGDPAGDGSGGPGYSIKGEFAANGVENPILHEAGVVSMARREDFDSAGSQFFIMLGDAPHLDGNYAAFGKVVSGLDVLEKLAQAPTVGETPSPPLRITSIRFK